MRSSAPPWPSIIVPQSFAPSERLIAESTSPPRKPATTIASAIAAASTGEKGVIHHSAAPIAVADSPPPTSPSQVLAGLIAGATLRRPKSLPKTYCSTSLNCTTAIRKKRSRKPPPSWPGMERRSRAGAWLMQ